MKGPMKKVPVIINQSNQNFIKLIMKWFYTPKMALTKACLISYRVKKKCELGS